MRLDRFDRFLVIGTVAGLVGFWLIWPPLSFLFLTAETLTLAFVTDTRTPPEPPEVAP